MSKNLFNSIQLRKPNRNVFDLSHDVKTSVDMGWLYPMLVLECVPGDKFRIGCESLLRFQPLVAPVMHRMDAYMHYFFVPSRLVWDEWGEWIMQAPSAPVHPTFSYSNNPSGSNIPYSTTPLLDYLGLPSLGGSNTDAAVVSAVVPAGYQMIYNEYYRDQNLVNEVNYKLTSGDNTANGDLFVLRKRAWKHDYFTSALPFAQKGNAVGIPLGQTEIAPVLHNNILNVQQEWTTTGNPGGASLTTHVPGQYDSTFTAGVNALYVAPTDVSPTTINDLRRAFRLQEWMEKNARAGTRYTEAIYAHFGVRSPDMRLGRPEYITGTKSPVVISEVLNTTGETAGLPQGNMAGHAISVTSGKYGGYYCQEHGFIIGIMSVLPLTAYQQGIPKHFIKWDDQFKYYDPSFAHLGEQSIENRELFAVPDTITSGKGTFGYTPRYSEYKYLPSRVSGVMKTTLDYWHLGRIFSTAPALNQNFIEADPRKDIFAVTSSAHDTLICHVLHKITAVRPMPKYGTPTI